MSLVGLKPKGVPSFHPGLYSGHTDICPVSKLSLLQHAPSWTLCQSVIKRRNYSCPSLNGHIKKRVLCLSLWSRNQEPIIVWLLFPREITVSSLVCNSKLFRLWLLKKWCAVCIWAKVGPCNKLYHKSGAEFLGADNITFLFLFLQGFLLWLCCFSVNNGICHFTLRCQPPLEKTFSLR